MKHAEVDRLLILVRRRYRLAAELRGVDREIRRVVHEPVEVAPPFVVGNLLEKIVQLLDANPAKPWWTNELIMAFPDSRPATVRRQAAALARSGRITYVDRGRYRSNKPVAGAGASDTTGGPP